MTYFWNRLKITGCSHTVFVLFCHHSKQQWISHSPYFLKKKETHHFVSLWPSCCTGQFKVCLFVWNNNNGIFFPFVKTCTKAEAGDHTHKKPARVLYLARNSGGLNHIFVFFQLLGEDLLRFMCTRIGFIPMMPTHGVGGLPSKCHQSLPTDACSLSQFGSRKRAKTAMVSCWLVD